VLADQRLLNLGNAFRVNSLLAAQPLGAVGCSAGCGFMRTMLAAGGRLMHTGSESRR